VTAAGFPPRLHVLLARDAATGVILRRGPSRSVAAIGWDRARDTFTLGQWLRGRIYERRSDLSPDGRHLIYFAMNGRWSSITRGAWTAISRAPYLAAIALFGKGDCWNGGGLFVDDRTYWLNDGYGHEVLADTTAVARAAGRPYPARWGGECPGVYFHRLLRDGWVMREDLATGARGGHMTVFERPLAHGWTLRKLAHAMTGAPPGKGVYHDEHELVRGAEEVMRHDWEWADVDGKRLVWATRGGLWAGQITRDDPAARPVLLRDFTEMAFEAIAAPYAAAKPRRAVEEPPPPAPKPKAKAKAKAKAKVKAKARGRRR
jgi:hypothetical protein